MSEKAEFVVEALGVSVANKATVAGAVTGAVGWAAQINWVGLSGVVVAVIGLLFSVYFQWRRDVREARAHESRELRETAESMARIAMMNAGIKPTPKAEDEHERA